MQFTGTLQNLLRNFYTQTGNFGFALTCEVDNTTGNYSFGVSGSQYNFGFSMNSGQIYYGNTLLHSYTANKQFTFEAQINTGNFNIIKDGTPLMYGIAKNTGLFNYFYFQRSGGSLNATFDLYVSGDNIPNYNLQNAGFLLSTGQTSVTGLLINYGQFPINVFQSAAQNPQNLTFVPLTGNVAGTGVGAFVFNGNYANFNFNYPILTTFNTNYGNSNVNFTIYNISSQQLVVLFQNISNYTIFNNQLTRTLNYNNYSGGSQTNNFSSNLYFQLTYITGSGSFAQNGFAATASYTGQSFGYITGSGLLTGSVSIPTGNATLTGNYVINFTQFQWATGIVTGTYSGISTGLGTGLGYTGRTVGIFSGVFTGIVLNNSGTLFINNILTGICSSGVSLDYTSYTNATGVINIQKLQYNDVLYLGTLNTPLIKGFQFFNETGLITYLSGNSQFLMNGYSSGNNIYLTARSNGTLGNGILISGNTCDFGNLSGSTFLTGGTNNGTTGSIVTPTGIFTGGAFFVLTGSGNYVQFSSGVGAGTFFFTQTFSGAWDIFTGITSSTLVSLKTGIGATYDGNCISGSGLFQPNSSMVFKVTNKQNPYDLAGAQLLISGNYVQNPIIQQLYN